MFEYYSIQVIPQILDNYDNLNLTGSLFMGYFVVDTSLIPTSKIVEFHESSSLNMMQKPYKNCLVSQTDACCKTANNDFIDDKITFDGVNFNSKKIVDFFKRLDPNMVFANNNVNLYHIDQNDTAYTNESESHRLYHYPNDLNDLSVYCTVLINKLNEKPDTPPIPSPLPSKYIDYYSIKFVEKHKDESGHLDVSHSTFFNGYVSVNTSQIPHQIIQIHESTHFDALTHPFKNCLVDSSDESSSTTASYDFLYETDGVPFSFDGVNLYCTNLLTMSIKRDDIPTTTGDKFNVYYTPEDYDEEYNIFNVCSLYQHPNVIIKCIVIVEKLKSDPSILQVPRPLLSSKYIKYYSVQFVDTIYDSFGNLDMLGVIFTGYIAVDTIDDVIIGFYESNKTDLLQKPYRSCLVENSNDCSPSADGRFYKDQTFSFRGVNFNCPRLVQLFKYQDPNQLQSYTDPDTGEELELTGENINLYYIDLTQNGVPKQESYYLYQYPFDLILPYCSVIIRHLDSEPDSTPPPRPAITDQYIDIYTVQIYEKKTDNFGNLDTKNKLFNGYLVVDKYQSKISQFYESSSLDTLQSPFRDCNVGGNNSASYTATSDFPLSLEGVNFNCPRLVSFFKECDPTQGQTHRNSVTDEVLELSTNKNLNLYYVDPSDPSNHDFIDPDFPTYRLYQHPFDITTPYVVTISQQDDHSNIPITWPLPIDFIQYHLVQLTDSRTDEFGGITNQIVFTGYVVVNIYFNTILEFYESDKPDRLEKPFRNCLTTKTDSASPSASNLFPLTLEGVNIYCPRLVSLYKKVVPINDHPTVDPIGSQIKGKWSRSASATPNARTIETGTINISPIGIDKHDRELSPSEIRVSTKILINPNDSQSHPVKSLYTDNARVYYKPHSLASGGIGTVRNNRVKRNNT